MDLDTLQITTEAELESLFVIPLLQSLGISKAQIRMQQTLRFQAGRHALNENVTEAIRDRRVRLDIRVTLDGRNLFIIEAKRRGTELTEDDALQAISYARLVHPIAPYALVTNGDQTRVYETVSRDRIWPDQINLEGGFDITLPDSSDFDALGCFLRLSSRNLLKFAHAQVTENMRALRGSADDLDKKYVPEVHQPRSAVRSAILRFLESSKTTLALISESGMGKTCTICHEALARLDDRKPVLFFRGSELPLRLLDEIADEFRWQFAETDSPQSLVGRLSRIVGEEKLLIFVDAVDQWTSATAVQQLGSLAKHLSGTNIKLVLSCKVDTWSRFLQHRDTPTDLSHYVESHGGSPGLLMGPLNDDEFRAAWRRYQKVYGFGGVWDPRLRDEARRNPFFMRLAFEVASEHKLLELRESQREIFDRYYLASLRKARNPNLAGRLIETLADLVLVKNADQISVRDLRTALQLSPLEELPWDLVDHGVVERISGGPDEDQVTLRFAFEGLRNYAIAFKACRWHELTEEELATEYDRLTGQGVQEEAWNAFYKLAPVTLKRVLDRALYEPALRFLHTYKEIIRTHFNAFASEFPPGDLDQSGLVLGAHLRSETPLGYGVRLLNAGDPEVLILPQPSVQDWWTDLMRYGADGLWNRYHFGSSWLDQHPAEELLRTNIAGLLSKAVSKGALNEGAAPELAKELIAAVVLSKPTLLSEPNKGSCAETLPLAAGRIEYWMLLNQHWARQKNELTSEKIRNGTIRVTREGGGITYSPPSLSEREREELRRRCDDLITSGVKDFGRGRHIPLDDIADRVRRAIECLPSRQDAIDGPLFPEAVDWRRGIATVRRVDSGFLAYVKRFVAAFLGSYEALIETNFPTLKEHFGLYRELPVICRATVLSRDEIPVQDRTLVLDFFGSDALKETTTLVEEVTLSGGNRWDREKPVTINKVSFPWLRRGCWVGIDTLWGNRRRYPDLQQRFEHTVLRDFTYWWIADEMPAVGTALGELYGVHDLKLDKP